MPGGKKAIPSGSAKSNRMYEHIKSSELNRGVSAEDAKRIAAATTNAQRAKSGEAKTTGGHANPRHSSKHK